MDRNILSYLFAALMVCSCKTGSLLNTSNSGVLEVSDESLGSEKTLQNSPDSLRKNLNTAAFLRCSSEDKKLEIFKNSDLRERIVSIELLYTTKIATQKIRTAGKLLEQANIEEGKSHCNFIVTRLANGPLYLFFYHRENLNDETCRNLNAGLVGVRDASVNSKDIDLAALAGELSVADQNAGLKVDQNKLRQKFDLNGIQTESMLNCRK